MFHNMWNMSFLLNLVAVYFICHMQECCSHYSEWTTNRMRFKLYAMDRELIKDAMQKIKSIQHMKILYSKTHSYQIADRIFFIRRKFARMMRVYMIAIDNIQKNYNFLLKCMEEINYLSMDIDHLVEMVTEFEKHHASDLVDIGGLMLPADMLSPSIIGGDMAGILGASGLPGGIPDGVLPGMPGAGGIPGAGGLPGAGGIPGMSEGGTLPGAGGIPGIPGSGGIPGMPEGGGLPKPGAPPGAGAAPRTGGASKFRSVPGAGRMPRTSGLRGKGRPQAFPEASYMPGSNRIRKYF